MLPPKPELTEIDCILPKVGVTKQDFQEWKPKPSEEERRALVLELDKVFMNIRQMIPRGDAAHECYFHINDKFILFLSVCFQLFNFKNNVI